MNEGLSYDDVLLIPQHSDVHSRADTILSTELIVGWGLKIPIIAANMPSVTGTEMACEMSRLGGIAFLPRFNNVDDAVADWRWVNEHGHDAKSIPSIGVGDYDRLEAHQLWGAQTFCLDVAHADHSRVEEFLLDNNHINWIVGNVATYSAALRLIEAGAKGIKVGIGPGAACVTREVTGHGVPQLTAIQEVARAISYASDRITLIADGGIKNSGDIVKALAAGADSVMIGRLLAGTNEAAMSGYYAGNASNFSRDKEHHAPEGVHGPVFEIGPLENVIKSLTWGIRSGLSYSGAYNLRELRENAEWMRVTPQTAIESGVRL